MIRELIVGPHPSDPRLVSSHEAITLGGHVGPIEGIVLAELGVREGATVVIKVDESLFVAVVGCLAGVGDLSLLLTPCLGKREHGGQIWDLSEGAGAEDLDTCLELQTMDEGGRGCCNQRAYKTLHLSLFLF